MSKRNFVCFECRITVRREPVSDRLVICPECNAECVNLGYKIPIPKKSKIKEWAELKNQYISEEILYSVEKSKVAVARKHEIEKEILKLSNLPPNKSREQQVRQLQNQLQSLLTQA